MALVKAKSKANDDDDVDLDPDYIDDLFEERKPKSKSEKRKLDDDLDLDPESKSIGKSSKVKKPRVSSTLTEDTEPAVIPDYAFGRVITTTYRGFTIPYHQNHNEHDEKIAQQVANTLKNDSILSLILFTVLRRCFNTANGQVAMFFATLTNSQGSYPVVIGHYNLWQRICMNCYSAFSPRSSGDSGIRKDSIRLALANFVSPNMHNVDLEKLSERTGADKMPTSRIANHSHFIMSIYFIRYAASALYDVKSVDRLLCSRTGLADGWCVDQRLTRYGLKDYMNFHVSSYKIVNTQQSKFKARSHFFDIKRDPIFSDETPSFGVEWSDKQLSELNTVRSFLTFPFTKSRKLPSSSHCGSFYEILDNPIRSREEILASMPDGVDDDRHLRQTIARNFSSKRDQEMANFFVQKAGLPKPKPGRPLSTCKLAAHAKRELVKCGQEIRAKRIMKKSASSKATGAVVPFVIEVQAPPLRRVEDIFNIIKSKVDEERNAAIAENPDLASLLAHP